MKNAKTNTLNLVGEIQLCLFFFWSHKFIFVSTLQLYAMEILFNRARSLDSTQPNLICKLNQPLRVSLLLISFVLCFPFFLLSWEVRFACFISCLVKDNASTKKKKSKIMLIEIWTTKNWWLLGGQSSEFAIMQKWDSIIYQFKISFTKTYGRLITCPLGIIYDKNLFA